MNTSVSKKAVLIPAFCALFFNVLSAGESGIVIGGTVGMSTLGSNTDYYNNHFELDGLEDEKNFSSFTYGVKLGYDFYFRPEQAIRAYGDYSRVSFDDDNVFTGTIGMNIFTFNLDYRYDILPILGAFVGGNYSFVQSSSDKSYGNNSTSGIGFNVGAVLAPLDFLEVEAKFRYLGGDLPEKRFNRDSTDPKDVTSKRFSLEDHYQFLLGVNLKF